MEWEAMAMGGPDSATMQVAVEDGVPASASVKALGGQAPTGVGPPLRANALGIGPLSPS